ncbi:VCBS repeat-containing protein [Rhodoblastus acidophilus]|uniref:Hint domain-containing protein n=1 Tax=Rhodoblastus acidophilus TaxID=1074 RepID=UPI00222498AE|nr:Hint domain-containing protein [Rhodoblastus acidophilus]MCW2282821.1 VCBS repeat-containing protein [Rhodoblastus acidophilus]MCW2331682.1 VCBS repeat-containing protein [Rhodoblastus acidophilus]
MSTDLSKSDNQSPTFVNSHKITTEYSSDGSITLVSTAADGTLGNNSGNSSGSWIPRFSPDGTKISFESNSSNLVAGDANNDQDVFVKDLKTGDIALVSTASDGSKGNGGSNGGVFSPDGTKIAFNSSASNLVAGDTNGVTDLFIKDLTTGATTRISTASDGGQANDSTYDPPDFSSDGTKIVFDSDASNLVAGDTNNAPDVFLKDLTTGAITRVSTGADGSQLPGSFGHSLSPDGSKIAFISYAGAIDYTHPFWWLSTPSQIFVKDLATGELTCVSTSADGTQSNGRCSDAIFSPDGTKIAFGSDATNLVANDASGSDDFFVKDLVTGAVTIVSSAADGTPANNYIGEYCIFSPDGTKIAFDSGASNLVEGDTNNSSDVFVRDLTTGAITRVSTGADGAQANNTSYDPSFSRDGNSIAFNSYASDLVAGDTNATSDIFVKTFASSEAVTSTLTGTVQDDPTKTHLTTGGQFLFADADPADTHSITVTAGAHALGTLNATLKNDSTGNQTGKVDWTYNIDESKVAALQGAPGTDTFVVTVTDTAGGVLTEEITVNIICFYPGTWVATPMGEAAVETLKAGDLVMTSSGEVAPIRWMGRQTVSTRFADPVRVLPIRIKAGALGENSPTRDLLVSPDHALMLGGVLIHAGALVNGATITREHDVPQVFTYWHIELADHALILAEGVAAETFVDNVDRLAFDNWREHEAAGDPPPMAEMTFPRVKSARQVPRAIRALLDRRAAAIGLAASEAA